MMRLSPYSKVRFLQATGFDAVFGGSEANVAVAISNYGGNATFISALPTNPLGDAAINSLRKLGVTVNSLRGDGRLGLYFLESGADCRPSRVIYDRAGSVFSLTPPTSYDWKKLFNGGDHFHTSGVTAGICENTAQCAYDAISAAKAAGLTTSVDLNYRAKLWQYGKAAPTMMARLVNQADILIGNESDIQNCLGITIESNSFPQGDCHNLDSSLNEDTKATSIGSTQNNAPNSQLQINSPATQNAANSLDTIHRHYDALCKKVLATYPNLSTIAITIRRSLSADYNTFSAVMNHNGKFYSAREYRLHNIVERVGSGDAFCGGLLFALDHYNDVQKALDYACASGVLKHTVEGDYPIATMDEVEALMAGNVTGRIQR